MKLCCKSWNCIAALTSLSLKRLQMPKCELPSSHQICSASSRKSSHPANSPTSQSRWPPPVLSPIVGVTSLSAGKIIQTCWSHISTENRSASSSCHDPTSYSPAGWLSSQVQPPCVLHGVWCLPPGCEYMWLTNHCPSHLPSVGWPPYYFRVEYSPSPTRSIGGNQNRGADEMVDPTISV